MWAEHIEHMDMLRFGTMSPEEATTLWLSIWRRGDRQLNDYRVAAREAQSQDGCASLTSAG